MSSPLSQPRRAPHPEDRGMDAVARVRAVRERDSRVGLLHALGSVREREGELARLEQALAEAQLRTPETLAGFAQSRQFLDAMARAVREAGARLDASHTVATEAHHRWQADRSRVRAVEHLLEQRAHRRREEADRAEARELDDIVGQLHARARTTEGGPS